MSQVISINEATISLGGRCIWHDVGLEIFAGEFVAILGPNGAGKSTLIKVILGLLSVDKGSVRVLDSAPGKANAQIGYLPQRRSFDDGLRIRGRDIVSLGLDGHRWGIGLPLADRWFRTKKKRLREQRISEIIEQVGATAYADRPIGELSGGEQQRLLIAQAMVGSPRLLILDEPLDSLDLPNQHAIAKLLEQLCRQENVAILLVAHDVNPIMQSLNRVVYVAAGNVLAGSPKEVISSSSLSSLYGVPVEVLSTKDGRLVVVGQPDVAAHGMH